MAQGDWTKEEAKATAEAVDELFQALPKSKQRNYVGHLNDIQLFLGRAQRELPAGGRSDEHTPPRTA